MKKNSTPTPAQRLKEVRHHLNLTLEAMVKKIGISRNSISAYEHGRIPPSPRYLNILHQKFGVNMNYIFGSEDNVFINRGPKETLYDFGDSQAEIEELLDYLKKIPPLFHYILCCFNEYKVIHRETVSHFLCLADQENGRDIAQK